MSSGAPVMIGRSLSKTFGPVTAVQDFDIAIYGGEITALVGDNGAGKSSLVKLLSGVFPADSGTIEHRGEVLTRFDPVKARARGIEVVYQDLALAPNLDVTSTLFLGREETRPGVLGRLGFLDRKSMVRKAASRVAELGIELPAVAGVPVATLSGGQRQVVAVAKAAAWATNVCFMDEPTAALGVRQAAAVLTAARRLADGGVAVVIISHALPHVLEVADRIVVIRHGRKVADLDSDQLPHVTAEDLVSLIVGLESASPLAERAEGMSGSAS